MSRRSRKRSRVARNQARHAEHLANQRRAANEAASKITGRPGATSLVMSTGSIQASPPRIVVGGGNKILGIEGPDPRSRGGLRLQPFTDYIPSVPQDFGAGRVNPVTQSRQVWVYVDAESGKPCQSPLDVCRAEHGSACVPGGRVWTSLPHEREQLESERTAGREAHESRIMANSRPEGAVTFTGDERHADDRRAGLYRDSLGNLMRTEDMEEYADRIVDMTRHDDWSDASLTCEVDEVTHRVRIIEVNARTGERRPRNQTIVRGVDSTMTTADYARLHGVPLQRNATQRAHAAAKAKAQRAADREATREEKRLAKEAARAQRAADRAQRTANTNTPDRGMIDEAARLMLSKMGITQPTKEHMRLARKAARESMERQRQVAEYTGA